MSIRVKGFVLGMVFFCLAAATAYPQQKANNNNNDSSLGDIARQLKTQKSKEPKPVMVITNDNIAGRKDDGGGVTTAAPAKNSADNSAGASGAPKGHDEAYFRSRLSKLQDQLETHKRELNVLQQKLGQNQMQYYPDPNKTLQQEYSRSDINALTDKIDAKKQQIADDEKAIDDLHDQLRHEGGDPGWLR